MEILAGAALCATGIGIAAVTGYSLSLAAGGVVVAGAGSIFHTDDTPSPQFPRTSPPSSKEEIALATQQLPFSLPQVILPSSTTELLVTAEGIWANGQFYPNTELMQRSPIAEELAKYKPNNDSLVATQSRPPLPSFESNILA